MHARSLAQPLAQAPERPDFDALYESTSELAFRVLGAMGVRDHELDDALQDVFVIAHRRLGDFRGASRPSTWVAGIAVRVAHDYRRRHARKPSEPLEPHAPGLVAAGNGPDTSAMRTEALRAVMSFIEGLPETQRDVFVLAELEQQTAPEIAQALGVPLNTVYSRLRLARAHFEAWVASRGDER
ncbi:MAG: sigma-70 family RNA polymerase sigma factor [Myxococcus sp.]|nr:sigma-70 family RNA polymerase sigma factor [Myxococcus sp.]